MQLNSTLQLGLSAAIKLFFAFIVTLIVLYFLSKADLISDYEMYWNILIVPITIITYGSISIAFGVLLMVVKLFVPKINFAPYVCSIFFVLFMSLFILINSIPSIELDQSYTQESILKNILSPILRSIGIAFLYFLVDISGVVDKIFFSK